MTSPVLSALDWRTAAGLPASPVACNMSPFRATFHQRRMPDARPFTNLQQYQRHGAVAGQHAGQASLHRLPQHALGAGRGGALQSGRGSRKVCNEHISCKRALAMIQSTMAWAMVRTLGRLAFVEWFAKESGRQSTDARCVLLPVYRSTCAHSAMLCTVGLCAFRTRRGVLPWYSSHNPPANRPAYLPRVVHDTHSAGATSAWALRLRTHLQQLS
jgi:hypothetical protein